MGILSLRKILTYLAIAALAFIALRFLLKAMSQYFVFTEASYTSYFWPRANWVLMHVLFGMTALLIGPLQFVGTIRRKYVKVHRGLGKTYLICVALGAAAGIYLSLTSKINIAYAGGLFSLAVAWVTTGLMAYISIRKGQTNLHKEWMMRCYVVTFAFVVFRLFDEILEKYTAIPLPDRLAFLSWFCWVIPLLFTEVILQGRKLARYPRP